VNNGVKWVIIMVKPLFLEGLMRRKFCGMFLNSDLGKILKIVENLRVLNPCYSKKNYKKP
jgi:hypothetical protein